jgi:tetratricopeptide (TPR) repeat protein
LSFVISHLSFAQFWDFPPSMPLELHKPLDEEAMRLQRNAMMFENRGEMDKALPVYQQLFSHYPEYDPFYEGMLRGWVATDNFQSGLLTVDSLRREMQAKTSLNGMSIVERERLAMLIVDGGRLAGRLDRREEAFKRWDDLYALPHPSSNCYFRLMSAMIECRYADALQDMVSKARQATGDPALLASSLASFWAQRGQSDKAVTELLSLMESQPRQAEAIQRQILSLPEDRETKDQVETTLKNALKRESIHLYVTQILAQFYFRNRQWEQAYEQTREADQLGGGSGESMLAFAETLLLESQPGLSLQVLDDMAASHPAMSGSPRSILARAKALEALGIYQAADSVYSKLTSNKILRTTQEHDALLLQARLKVDHLRQPAAARELLSNGLQNNPRLRGGGQISLLIGDTYLVERNLEKARNIYLEASQGVYANDPDVKARALVSAAQIDLCLGQVSQAMERLGQASAGNPEGKLANDALDLAGLLAASSGDSSAAINLARADLEKKLGESARAESLFTAVLQLSKAPELTELAVMKLARLYRESARPTLAISTLQDALNRFPKSLRAPEFLLLSGQIREQDLGDTRGAINEYERILVDYPNSLSAHEARRRIRELESVKT